MHVSGRFRSGSDREQYTSVLQASPPSLAARAVSLARATTKWLVAGRPLRDGEEVARLYGHVCVSCEHREPAAYEDISWCRKCGCRCRYSAPESQMKHISLIALVLTGILYPQTGVADKDWKHHPNWLGAFWQTTPEIAELLGIDPREIQGKFSAQLHLSQFIDREAAIEVISSVLDTNAISVGPFLSGSSCSACLSS